MKEITAQELAHAIENKESFTLLDVREPYEYEIGHLDCTHIPMGEIPSRANELDNTKTTYVICRSGKRAEAIANFLCANHDFRDIAIITGGVTAYAEEVDQSIEV
ncbi:rhodanese-like domain-containing protein [Brumimicrobium aurantiacum]|nr:rhodanese-like domain-containing protein [Brumimicrobium aurantiacum]